MNDSEETLPEGQRDPGEVGGSPAENSDARIGTRVGPYRILRRIDEGGMGTVYLAAREDHFEQRVALKMIHLGKTTDALLQRFYAERQILADLDHPHIARIYDGGATHGSLPYFVMEYVEGRPFDRACAELGLVTRLALFQKVCAAVHHAHRNLVVHRDLKPSNILVTADGEPKLLDFGIAKLLRPDRRRDEDGSPSQRPDPGPMTLAFASPEQLLGEPITIGTDIYSLGVLLYEILAGRHPHHRPGISTAELVDAICNRTPPRPSEVADVGIAGRLAGDLDAIVLKATSKRPEDRYDSAAQLAEEIQLHLDDRPVRAWPGTWRGRLRKSARRHKLAVASLVFLFLFGTTVTGLWRHAVQQQVEAERSRAQAERTRDFILEFFESMEPDRRPGPGIDLEQILDSGRLKLEASLTDEPEVRADLLGTLARIYHTLALYDDALLLQEQALDSRRRAEPRDGRKLAVDLNNLASSHYARGDLAEAEALFRESLPLWSQLQDPYEPRAMANLAATVALQGRNREALEIYQQALRESVERSMGNDSNTAAIYHGLGAAHKHLGEQAAAELYLRRASDLYAQNPEIPPSRRAQVRSSLGEVLHDQGRLSEARIHLEAVLEERLRLFGEHHPRTAASQRKLALLQVDLGELEAAEALLQRAADTYRALGHEEGAAQVRAALDRWLEVSAKGP